MSEEERFHTIIQEIKEIYLFLTQGEPTPDDEIEARSNLMEKVSEIKNLNTFQAGENMILFEDALNKLENWDTLDLWFIESEVPEYIQSIIKITDDVPELPADRETEQALESRSKADLEAVQIDIEDIVGKVSEQFKGEIDDLKQKIEFLKHELEEKDKMVKRSSRIKVVKTIKPKKDVLLPPPEIRIPTIKKPEKAPQVKVERKLEEEKPNEVKSLQDVQVKIEEKLEKSTAPPIIEEQQKKPQIDIGLTEIPEQPKAPKQITEKLEKKIETQEKEKPKIQVGVIEDEAKSISDIFKEESISDTKESIVISEEQSEDLTEEEEKIPFIAKKPKIATVTVEEIETEPIKSTGSDLFNVFSSVGSTPSEKTTKSEKTISPISDEQQKIKESEIQERSSMPFVDFNTTGPEIVSSEESLPTLEELPTDKDSLYQELIALEGKRYSLEKNFKEIEKSYTSGSIDDLEYNKQSDNLKNRLNNITSRINKIRRVIASL
ncbi:MAG: hypothetical protein ACFFB0_21565 [Promethearchaeota archaeon]